VKFFIPGAKNAQQAEEVYAATKNVAETTLGGSVTDRRIFAITYQHEGREYRAEVGQLDPRVDETVMVILESNAYLVCTKTRGVLWGAPVLVGHEEVLGIIDFE
jgi:hypothetical protein